MSRSIGQVVVVGSLNWDVTCLIDRTPEPGQTVLMLDRVEGPGGKGANQALAARGAGAEAIMVGRVGTDGAAERLVNELQRAGVSVSRVVRGPGKSGGAIVLLCEDGENSIIVHPEANAQFALDGLNGASQEIETADVVLVSLEIPLPTALRALRDARGTAILNPAPAPSDVHELIAAADVVIPNRSELATLAGRRPVRTIDEAAEAARRVNAPTVIVTLGADGALIRDVNGSCRVISGATATPVDTSGAGDVFCGTFAAGVAAGLSLETSVRRAVVAGAIAVETRGACPPRDLAVRLAGLI